MFLFYNVIITVVLAKPLSHHEISISFLVVGTVHFWSLDDFEVCPTVLFIRVTMLCVRSPELAHLVVAGLYIYIYIYIFFFFVFLPFLEPFPRLWRFPG